MTPEVVPGKVPSRLYTLRRGLQGVLSGLAWFGVWIALGVKFNPGGMHTHAWWWRACGGLAGLAGVALVTYGLWQAGRARDGRWDLLGLGAAMIQTVGWLLLLLWLLYAVLSVSPGGIYGS